MNKYNEILIRRKYLVNIPYEIDLSSPYTPEAFKEVFGGMVNLQSLGFTFSSNLINTLLHSSTDERINVINDMIEICKHLKGADVEYHPMYPGFPEVVMEMETVDLIMNAIIHYWTDGLWYPESDAETVRPALFEDTECITIDVANKDTIREIMHNFMISTVSLSQQDKEDLQWYLLNWSQVEFPEKIPFKETLSFIVTTLAVKDTKAAVQFMEQYAKTVTDVLRIAVELSGYDGSLVGKVKFKTFSRAERRMFLAVLNQRGNMLEDMKRNSALWIHFGEKLHPGEFQKQYPKAYEAFKYLRSGRRIITFNGRVEDAVGEKDAAKALELLMDRPGEFARRLDQLLVMAENKDQIVDEFKRVAAKVSSRVLLQVIAHFKDRENPKDIRTFIPKGNMAKPYFIANQQEEIPKKYLYAIIRFCENALITQYVDREFMGNVYISPELVHYKAPMTQRSASKTFRTIGKGSRLPIKPDATTIRAFIWWTNLTKCGAQGWANPDRVDIDLSAVFYNAEWNYHSHVSYTNLRFESGSECMACHSGDITNGGPVDGDGVSEFIDVNIDKALATGAKYVVFSIHAFTQKPFCDMPNCKFGWMEREKPDSGEIYDPRTVKQLMDVTANSITAVPMIFDLESKEAIWVDMSNIGVGTKRKINNIETYVDAFGQLGKGLAESNTINLYELARLNATARGVIVDTPEEADTVFDMETGITPYDSDIWQALI